MTQHANMVKVTAASPGTGSVTVSTAVSGFRTFAQGFNSADATVAGVRIQDASDATIWEICRNCAYTFSTNALSRGTREDSSTGGAVNFTGSVIVSVIETAGFGNGVENLAGAWGALSGENSITAAATAVIGRLNVCSGTSANYEVALPAVSGNSGKYIGFRMAPGLTKLVTLNADGTETIDGSLTRVMWAGETALLYCDGSTWTKMAGKTRPMTAIGSPSGNTTVPTGGETRINLNTAFSDPTGLMCDTANNEMLIPRDGIYRLVPCGRISNASAALSRWYSGIHRDRGGSVTQWIVLTECYTASGGYVVASIAIPFTCLAGDKLRLYVGGTNAGNETAAGSGNTSNSFLAIEEMPSW